MSLSRSDIERRADERLGIASLTPMQAAVAECSLPLYLRLIAPTGSGKTLAFAIPLLQAASTGASLRAAVMVPTRELALQVYDVVRRLAYPDVRTVALYGGHAMEAEVNELRADPQAIVATPGRLLDHVTRGDVDLAGVSMLVLDEYDKAIDLGFYRQMKALVGRMPSLRSIVLTSATAATELPDFLSGHTFRTLDYSASGQVAAPDIRFRRVDSPAADKAETLAALLADLHGRRTIVFVNHREAAERLYKYLKGLDSRYPVALYHGGLDQDKREQALVLFANGTCPVLVSTDLGARGLDIDGVDAVVHYHLPVSEEAMTHRNGRTARMGASGDAYAIISDKDRVPDFFPALDTYWPANGTEVDNGTPGTGGKNGTTGTATLYINAGRKEKISRGDVAGYIIRQGGLTAPEVGQIDIKDHCAYVAVPADKVESVLTRLAGARIKNVRVRVSRVDT